MTRIRRKTPLKDLLPDEETRAIYKRLQYQYVRYGLPVGLGDYYEQSQFIAAGTQFCIDYPETQFIVAKSKSVWSISIVKRKNKK